MAALAAMSGCTSIPQSTGAYASAADETLSADASRGLEIGAESRPAARDAASYLCLKPQESSLTAMRGAAGSPLRTSTVAPTTSSVGAAAPAAGYAATGLSGNGRIAEVMAEQSDDAIIARRLRRAAEAETDPQVRAKLWDEYARYSGQSPGP